MEAIVLAGGLGTRLAGRLNGVPKPMVPIAGRPFLEILLNQLKRAGCGRVVLSVGHLHNVIQDFFGTSFNGMNLEYAIESVPLGTGGAIRLALQKAREESVLVLNGDTFLDADYGALLRFHVAERTSFTIAVVQVENAARYGRVLFNENRIVGFEEKGRSGPGWINAGTYVIEKRIQWPHALPEKFSIESDVLSREIGRLAPAAYPVNGFFLDIGLPEDLDRAQTELASYFV
jgi:D-glycero-alpha-D-manno-heptose 1-phosphate guanylyltransferase